MALEAASTSGSSGAFVARVCGFQKPMAHDLFGLNCSVASAKTEIGDDGYDDFGMKKKVSRSIVGRSALSCG